MWVATRDATEVHWQVGRRAVGGALVTAWFSCYFGTVANPVVKRVRFTIWGICNPKKLESVIGFTASQYHSASFPSFTHPQTAAEKGSADDIFPFWVEGDGPTRLHGRQGLDKCGWCMLVRQEFHGSVSAAWSGKGVMALMLCQRQGKPSWYEESEASGTQIVACLLFLGGSLGWAKGLLIRMWPLFLILKMEQGLVQK